MGSIAAGFTAPCIELRIRTAEGYRGSISECGGMTYVSAISLSYNQAANAGPEGISEGLNALKKAGIPSFGAGATGKDACRPWRMEHKGVKIAFFGISYFEKGAAGSDQAGVALILRSLGQAVYSRNLKGADSGIVRVIEVKGNRLKWNDNWFAAFFHPA